MRAKNVVSADRSRESIIHGSAKSAVETPVKRKGVSKKRVKKKLRAAAMKGSPTTQVAGEAILEDLASGKMSSALDTILEAEEESKPEECEGITASQQVANEAIQLKKLEHKIKACMN